jgi:CubicO group peptidase (beta-lactamase class C family)
MLLDNIHQMQRGKAMNIDSFVSAIEKQKLICEGIIVLQHGEKIAEHRWIPESPRNVFSVSKSFVSIAVGMAVDRGKLSLASRLVDVFPRLAPKPGKRLAALNLEHLLTMARGYKEFSQPATVAEALAQPLTYQPGTHFQYDNASTFLASAMFTYSMGITVREFLLDALFRPLGIPDPEWPETPDGHTVGSTDLVLTTSNLATFGQFLLQRGEWKGKQLVSPGWIDAAGRPQIKTGWPKPDQDLGYGFCFWPCRYGIYRADGKNSQLVIVHPRKDVVIAINSNDPDPFLILYTVWDEILPLL